MLHVLSMKTKSFKIAERILEKKKLGAGSSRNTHIKSEFTSFDDEK